MNKLFLTSLLAFIAAEAKMQIALAVSACYTIAICLLAPFVRKPDDRMSLISQSAIYSLLLCGLLLYSDDSSFPESGSLVDVALSVVLIGLTLLVLLLFAHHLLL